MTLLLLACRVMKPPGEPDDSAYRDCAEEVPYDGIDQDCDGADLDDVDGDGYSLTDDCDDDDGAVNPDAAEVAYDGIDQDCDGADLDDVDGDGYDLADDCDDDDSTVFPGGNETAFDGIDQDCDGADSLDGDGDGHDAAGAGGDDCDDGDATAYPGAAEVAYDGVDQDCDGADLVDADGDGYAYADDCDDEDAASHPDADEAGSDAADNDCDGLVDETEVCADGTADYATVQEGADATADGGTVEICAGTYVEAIVLEERALTLYGAGESPDDVVLEAPEESSVLAISGESADLTLQRVWITATDEAALHVVAEDVAALRLESVRLAPSFDGDLNVYMHSDVAGATLIVSDSWLEDAVVQGMFIDGNINLSRSVADGAHAWADLYDDSEYPTYTAIALDVANVVAVGGGLRLAAEGDDRTTVTIDHVTYGDDLTDGDVSIEFLFYSDCYILGEEYDEGFADTDDCPTVLLSNTILADIDIGVFLVLGVSNLLAASPADSYPSVDASLAWSLGDPLGMITLYSHDYVEDPWNGDVVRQETDDVSSYLEAAFTWADPVFVASAEQGSYSLDAASPAVDAGTGDADADGSVADMGAFGGPDSDWWRSFEWPVP